MQYVILDDKKRATHGFKDGVGAKTWKEVRDFDNVGLIVPKPFIVLDFDTKSDAEIMLRIVVDKRSDGSVTVHGPPCRRLRLLR